MILLKRGISPIFVPAFEGCGSLLVINAIISILNNMGFLKVKRQ
jgi:hypothetical protein